AIVACRVVRFWKYDKRTDQLVFVWFVWFATIRICESSHRVGPGKIPERCPDQPQRSRPSDAIARDYSIADYPDCAARPWICADFHFVDTRFISGRTARLVCLDRIYRDLFVFPCLGTRSLCHYRIGSGNYRTGAFAKPDCKPKYCRKRFGFCDGVGICLVCRLCFRQRFQTTPPRPL